MKWGGCAVVLVTLTALSCSTTSRRPPLFPEAGEAAGWSRAGEPHRFDAGNLWQYNDGDAERYIRAGVEQLVTADYQYQGKAETVADVYIMRDSDGARAIFESESAVGSQPIALGDAGRLYGASLTFRQRRYFVRLVAHDPLPASPPALLELAQAIEAKIGNQPRL